MCEKSNNKFEVPIKEKFTELNYKLKVPEPKRYKLEDIYPVEDCYYLMNIDNLDIFWQRNDDLGERHEEFEDFYNVYGFDIRETWALDYVIAIFLYTRLMAYKYHSAVDFENENEKEFKEDLDKMIFTFGSIVKDNKIFEEKYAEDKEYKDKILEGFDAFKRSFFRLWW